MPDTYSRRRGRQGWEWGVQSGGEPDTMLVGTIVLGYVCQHMCRNALNWIVGDVISCGTAWLRRGEAAHARRSPPVVLFVAVKGLPQPPCQADVKADVSLCVSGDAASTRSCKCMAMNAWLYRRGEWCQQMVCWEALERPPGPSGRATVDEVVPLECRLRD